MPHDLDRFYENFSVSGVTFDGRPALIQEYVSTFFDGNHSLDDLPTCRLVDDNVYDGIQIFWGDRSIGWIPAKPDPKVHHQVPLLLMRNHFRLPSQMGQVKPRDITDIAYGVITEAGTSKGRPYAVVAVYRASPGRKTL